MQPPADTSQQVSVSLFQLKAFSEDLVNVPSGFIVSEGKKRTFLLFTETLRKVYNSEKVHSLRNENKNWRKIPVKYLR